MKEFKIKRIVTFYFGFQDGIALLLGLSLLVYTLLRASHYWMYYFFGATLLLSISFEKTVQKLVICNIVLCFIISHLFGLIPESVHLLNIFTPSVRSSSSMVKIFSSILFIMVLVFSAVLTPLIYLKGEDNKSKTVATLINYSFFILGLVNAIILTQERQIEFFSVLSSIPKESLTTSLLTLTFLLSIYMAFTIYTLIYYNFFMLMFYLIIIILFGINKIKYSVHNSVENKSTEKSIKKNKSKTIRTI
ncbi:MAG: hypothetical protein GF311_02880 [Candidatus Lokiarchaeota archaeon]|nr:hypothetical protein [Candidatus Lokiarchaeota archaeon]